MRSQAAFLAQDSIASRYISGVSVELSLIKKNRRAEARHHHILVPMEMTRCGINRLGGGGF